MIETVTQTVGNDTYDLTQMGAKQGQRTLMKLVGTLGPLAGQSDVLEQDVSAIAKTILGESSEQLVEHLCDTFAKLTMVHLEGNDKKVLLSQVFDQHFAGEYGQMLLWLAACLKVNYANFFDGLASGSLIAEITSQPSA